MYIRSTGNISPQKTFGHQPLVDAVVYTGNRLACIEPDYKAFIDPKQIRRMSRIIRMGVAAAMECLQEAGIKEPDAIVTGTAYGCLEDTNLFLSKMVEFNEDLLTPTAFIQSTHNTIGAQIGLLLKSNHYNNTFVHRGFSFESALLDGMMLLKENEATNVLVGAIDEITNPSHAILNRMGLYKQGPVSNLDIYKTRSRGTIAGEGSAFFLLAKEPSATDYAKLDGLHTFYKPAGDSEIEEQLNAFLEKQGVKYNDIDLIITGNNGDAGGDKVYEQLAKSLFQNNDLINYKHLCGEYPTASAFAMWLGATVIRSGELPAVLNYTGSAGKKINRVLIYNHYMGIHHSLSLLSAC
ncbi:MAG TPA: beta-ketoacyl synthase chain length factor [Ferruginibacter sp.]|nr:beta-ketoacyl synthase chain length factor [Chitinophagaceae bacterium]MBK9531975.1 beta-ketoacyl synthase chain length factor [Chitinophagaceae bacterium]HQW92732.1 beta-ketoacyl synthase chain length factor [Ferruginibacter sp.]